MPAIEVCAIKDVFVLDQTVTFGLVQNKFCS
jgi:hypothetical protein